MRGVRVPRLAFLATALTAVLLRTAGCASAPHSTILPADDEYAQGIDALGREQWSTAAEHLNRLVLNYPADPRAAQARYLLGQANFHSEEYPSAAQDFERFQQDFPTDSLADDALYWAGRSHEAQALKPELDQSETQRAVGEYTELRRQYPASPFADEARERMRVLRDRLAAKEYLNARYYFKQRLWKATEIYVRSLVEQYPESSYVAPAYLILVQAYEAQGRDDDAQRIRDTLIEEFPDSPEARQVGRTPRETGETSSAAAAASSQSGEAGEAR